MHNTTTAMRAEDKRMDAEVSPKGERHSADDPPSDFQEGRSAVTRVTKNRVEEEKTRAEVPSLGEGDSVDDLSTDAPPECLKASEDPRRNLTRPDRNQLRSRPVHESAATTRVENDA